MPIIISGISCPYTADEHTAFEKAVKQLSLSKSQICEQHIYKKSIDARKQNDIRFVYSVFFQLKDTALEQKLAAGNRTVKFQPECEYEVPVGNEKLKTPVYIVGFGPAGIFAAYRLAQCGYCPIVFERGAAMEDRCQDVESFWEHAEFHADSNVQFGEGGAGTFSDGKLTTRISDRRCSSVLGVFKKFGAPEEIEYIAKPHIGTDQLRLVIQNIRNEIVRLGGQVYFHHKLEKIEYTDHKLSGIVVNGKHYPTQNVILAIGHSARDTFRMLADQGIMMQNKPFSVGVRAEHLQTEINKGLYGKFAEDPRLPQGEYQLSYHTREHCVYTFCMCPGGYVVPSASAEETVVTNGMSHHARDGRNANAAVVVSVNESDYGTNLLDGILYQEKLEKAAFLAGGKNYKAPASLVGNFLNPSSHTDFGRVEPTYAIGVKETDLRTLFDPVIADCLKDGLLNFDHKVKGYAAKDAVLTGVETRTSSPVRILRNEELESISAAGLYPCGEGAGYAGGIMSAAVDGIKIAEKIIEKYQPLREREE